MTAAPREQKLLAAGLLGLALLSSAVATQTGPFQAAKPEGKIQMRVTQTAPVLPTRALAFSVEGAPRAETPAQAALLRETSSAPVRLAAWPLRDLRPAEKRAIFAAAPLPPPRPAALAMVEPDPVPSPEAIEARHARLDRLRAGFDALAAYAPSPRLIPGASLVADAVSGLSGKVVDLVALNAAR